MGVAALIFIALVFYNIYTRVATGAIVALGALYVFFTLERWESQIHHLNQVRLMIQGYIHYNPDLSGTVVWAMVALLALIVVIFMLYRFSFYILALTGVAILLFTWGPGFTSDAFPFLLFIVCFCLLIIRKTNNGLAAVYVAMPICAALVWLVYGQMPREADLFERRTLQELFDGPLSTVSDFIYTLTNPMYFSFQSTGFSSQGGRLGGPVTPNARNVMTVQAPGRTYLTGVIHNTYTGYRWHSTLEHGQLYTQGMSPNRFEMLEPAVAMIRSSTIEDDRTSIPMSLIWNLFEVEDHRHLHASQFATLGLGDYLVSNYLHTYLPMSTVTVAIGQNRTGTVFRPLNMRDISFHHTSPDYSPVLIFEPSGDMRAPTFMARNTQYASIFLNVNPRLTFVHEILNNSLAGIHSAQVPQGRYVRMIQMSDGTWAHLAGGTTDFSVVGLYDDEGIQIETTLTLDELNDMITHQIHVVEQEVFLDGPSVTAEDMHQLISDFSHQGPNREIRYWGTNAEIMAMLDNFSYHVLARYAETVREQFMEVPDIVPQRVHDLVDEIIYGLTTDFERVMAIRDYLIQFPYTLTPPPVPDGVCFVDHFLFDVQEGYCTYYATAMAIMSRIAGVPSRYVEGFLLPPSDEYNSIFAVTNMMAHAWVEVYLEGFGWLIVEATAPYAFFTDPSLPIPPGGFNPDMFIPDWTNWMGEYLEEWPGDWTGAGGAAGSNFTPQGGGAQGRGGPSVGQARLIVLAIIVAVIVLLLAYVALRYGQVLYRGRRIKEKPVNQQITGYFGGIMDITSYCTKAKSPGETPYAYGQRVGKRFRFKSDSVLLKDLVDLYYRARYGYSELSEGERKLMEDSYHDMVEYLKREHNKPNYLYMRYVRQVGSV